jgi:hypothetical protein
MSEPSRALKFAGYLIRRAQVVDGSVAHVLAAYSTHLLRPEDALQWAGTDHRFRGHVGRSFGAMNSPSKRVQNR